jgi:hypothetical protein
MATKVEKRFPNKYLLLWWQICKIVWDVDELAWGNPLARLCHSRSSGHLTWHEWWVAKLQKRHVSSPHRVSPVCFTWNCRVGTPPTDVQTETASVSGEDFGHSRLRSQCSPSNRLQVDSFLVSLGKWGLCINFSTNDGWFSWSPQLQLVVSQTPLVPLQLS